MSACLSITREAGGKLLRLSLDRPKANIVDAEMIAALENAFSKAAHDTDLAAVLLSAEGPHFSFGASVEEHLPEHCEGMLKSLHKLIRMMLAFPLPVLVAVRGQCLGGGLEVAMAGHMIFAAPDAQLGQPEMKLGVFAPAASVLMPERMGQPLAQDLLLSGRSMGAGEALEAGLIDHLTDEPEDAARAYVEKHLAPKSTSSLRLGVRAAREPFLARVLPRLDEVERIYLTELMSTRDAVEGLTAFLAKRPPEWENC
ncbi:MAG TPA: cyclohexa-1,5-dienecarbonyl-CoA hydratase [Aliiroseovarius sp.]|nr:cyclohexa-1,5-dienecarbonyl-CoA hydratase [Aliiroseovarius sp.]